MSAAELGGLMTDIGPWYARLVKPAWQPPDWLFAANAFFNLLWSLLFFRLKRPDWALVEVGLLWLSVLALIVALWPIKRRASMYLAPYLAWVAFAAVLNLAIVRLNAPFT